MRDSIDRESAIWHVRANAHSLISQIKALEELPPAQPEYKLDEWCTDCKEYNHEKHCCPRFNRVIRTAMGKVGAND